MFWTSATISGLFGARMDWDVGTSGARQQWTSNRWSLTVPSRCLSSVRIENLGFRSDTSARRDCRLPSVLWRRCVPFGVWDCHLGRNFIQIWKNLRLPRMMTKIRSERSKCTQTSQNPLFTVYTVNNGFYGPFFEGDEHTLFNGDVF